MRKYTRRNTLADRFWKYTLKGPGCWLWTGSTYGSGYGVLRTMSSRGTYPLVAAHRISYELHFGPIPKGMMCCHICDRRDCVRPDHLFLGTASDNNWDMASKGRHGQTRRRAAHR